MTLLLEAQASSAPKDKITFIDPSLEATFTITVTNAIVTDGQIERMLRFPIPIRIPRATVLAWAKEHTSALDSVYRDMFLETLRDGDRFARGRWSFDGVGCPVTASDISVTEAQMMNLPHDWDHFTAAYATSTDQPVSLLVELT